MAVAEHLLDLDDGSLDDRLRGLELQRRRVVAEQALAIAEAERRSLHLADGHHSLTAYLRATLNCSTGEANEWKRLARLVSTVPGVADALIQGRIGVGQAHELARVRANPRCGDRLIEVRRVLLEQAEMLDFADFRTCVRRWELLADTDGAHRDRDASVEARNATAVPLGAGVDLRASGGDAVTAAELIAILDAFTRAEYDRDVAARSAAVGADAAAGTPLPRTGAQRRFDALVEIFRRGANAPDGTGRRVDVTVDLVVDERTYTEHLVSHGLAPADAIGPTHPNHVVDPGPERRRCETATGTPVHPDDVVAASIHGHIRRVVYDGAGVVINLGRRRRLFIGAARDAARLSARRCSRNGCSIPSQFCDIDHVHDHAHGGATDAINGDPACGTHNRQKNHGYTTIRDPVTGRVIHYRPDGSPLTPAGCAAPVPGHPGWRLRRIHHHTLRPLDLPDPDPPDTS